MLPLYSNSVGKVQFTVVYRGYDLDVTRAVSGWRVGVHPKTADLPILGRSEIYAHDLKASSGTLGAFTGESL